MYVLSIDQSTSATKAIVIDNGGRIVSRTTIEHSQYYPYPGWVEHDAEEIYEKTVLAIRNVLQKSGIDRSKVAVIAVTNQRETVLVWDRYSGKPVCNAIVWQCRRAADNCRILEEQGLTTMARAKSGLVLSPYFSGPKIQWILQNVKDARKKAEAGHLLYGTMDAWLIWKLTCGKVHATDYSNASRTLLFNIRDLQWDEELLHMFNIPRCMTPEVKCSDEVFGYTTVEDIFDKEIPISGVMGDSHAALFGQNCFEKGMTKTTYGTGCSIMMNIGSRPLESKKGLVTSIAWGMDNRVDYVFEGNINCAGATIKWLTDELELIESYREAGGIAASIKNNGGVYIVPAFTGLGAPYWDSRAKAGIYGITLGSKKAHIVRAAEESIAYQIKDVVDLMVKEAGIPLQELRVDGGPTRDAFLMQFQSDILDVEVVTNKIEELSALGAAYMAGIAVGLWKNKEEIQKMRIIDKVFKSTMDSGLRGQLYVGWKEAVQRTLSDNPADHKNLS
jgi:glycerol kinase